MRPAFFICASAMEIKHGRPMGMSNAHLESMPTSKKIDELYDLIRGIETAMFTTRRPNGQLVSRPMATQDRIDGADLWFVTDTDTHKVDELAMDPHVNLASNNGETRKWGSVAGLAPVSMTRTRIRQLTQEDWKGISAERAPVLFHVCQVGTSAPPIRGALREYWVPDLSQP